MEDSLKKIAFGGGCHWCTEAVFQSLVGVKKVEQGFIASTAENSDFSEAVIVHYNSREISVEVLVKVHLATHNSTSNHSMRKKYRSAIYFFNVLNRDELEDVLRKAKSVYEEPLVTELMPFKEFKPSRAEITNYYVRNPEKPFCNLYIKPKIEFLKQEFNEHFNKDFILENRPVIKS